MADELTTTERSELQQLETVIEHGLQTFYEVGQALLDIKERELYKEFGTFEDYCERRWGLNARYLRRIRAATEIRQNIIESGPIGPLPETEGQTRPLSQLTEPEQQVAAWQIAVESAANGRITSRHVEAAVKAVKQVEQETAFDYKRDNKSNRAADAYVPQGYDACQTPPYALDPLLPYLLTEFTIWEPAQGEGLLVDALYDSGFETVIGTDMLTGQNFLEYEPEQEWHIQVTNPPFSLKYKWLERSYELGKPFALLLPVETLGAKTAQELMKRYGFEIMLLNRRVSFKMPNKGWDGAGAQFPVMWLCWQLLPERIVFGEITSGDYE